MSTEPSLERPIWLNRTLGGASGRGVRVAVVDSGIDRDALGSDRIERGWGLVDSENELAFGESRDDRDRIGHGTACSHIVLHMAPEVMLLPLRVFGRELETSPNVIVAAIERAIDEGADVINLSLGTPTAEAEATLAEVCARAEAAGRVLVSARPRGVGRVFPAAFDTVIAVTADSFANIHDFVRADGSEAESGTDYLAQGGRRVPWPGESELRRIDGSSFAAPHIAGLVALLRERFPGADPPTIRRLLGELSRPSGIRG